MLKKIVSLVLVLLFVNVICFAKVKNYKAEATEDIPSNKAQDEVVSSLLQSLTKQAIEQSGIKLSDYDLSDSEYNQFVKDVTKVEVKNKKVFMKKDNLQAVNIKLNVAMDADIAKAYLFKIKTNKDKKAKENVVKQAPVISSSVAVAPVNTQVSNSDIVPANVSNEMQDKSKAEDKVKTEISTSTAKVEKPVLTNVNVSSAASVTEKTQPKEKISINKALQDAQTTKQEVDTLLGNFDNSLKESEEEIVKSYDSKISKINLNVKKDQWETTKQYNNRIEKNKQEKVLLEQEKEKAVSDNKVKIAQMAVSTIKPQIDKLKSYQTDKFFDENSVKAKIISLGAVNADEKFFEMKILYENEQSIISTLKYDFSDIGVEKAKKIYKTPNKFIIEPLFSVEENEETGNLQKVLTAFGIKHANVEQEKIVNLSEKIKPFKEITTFETYNSILNNK
ncbi:MAG: hypothetical protein IKN42_02415 [Elusimicrobia bacterium]|nr:hypothetical protein [Elusimicrobiota bacterium]